MPRKTKIIFIIVFIVVGVIMLGIYFYNSSKSTGTGGSKTSIYEKFNPFGTSDKNNTGGEGVVENPTTETETPTESSKFKKLTNFAVAGATFFEDERLLPIIQDTENVTPTESTTTKTAAEPTSEMVPSLRYVERVTGHVYQMYLDTKIEGKISNSTIPGVHETIFDGKASSIIYRYTTDDKTITSFLATLGGKSNFLSTDILEVSLSPDKSKFFSIVKNKNGVVGITQSFSDTKTSQVFTSSFSEWLTQWPTEKSIFLTTKPSYLVDGSVFNLNVSTGTLYKIFGGIKGLTTLANNDGTSILFGASLETGPKLNIFNVKTHTSMSLDKYGLPEKCVWSSDNINVYCAIPNTVVGTQYPDSWYQGLISFDDRFVKINTLTGDSSTIANSSDEIAVDGTNLFLSKAEDKLFFINKKDYTLWSLDL